MPDTIAECERTAHSEGLAAGLALALTGVDAGAPPGRVAAVPSSAVPAGAEVLEHRLAGLEGISLVRCDGHRTAPAAELTAFGARLGAARLGLSCALALRAVDHLAARLGGGEPLLRKQLVAGALADVMASAEAIRRALRVAGDVPAAVTDAHDRLTALDWETAKLFGASGYVADGPARGAYVSRLTANCWIAREGDVP